MTEMERNVDFNKICLNILQLSFFFLELFTTEHAHVRMLSVLQMVFVKPLEKEAFMASFELDAIFPSLDDMLEEHCECCILTFFFLFIFSLNVTYSVMIYVTLWIVCINN